MMRGLKFFCAGYICCLILLGGSTLAAEAPRIIELQVGLGKQCQLGYWTPVRVHVQAGEQDFSGDLELATADSDGLLTVYSGFSKGPIEIAIGEKKWLTGYVKFTHHGGLKIRLLEGDKVVTEADYPRSRLPKLIVSTNDRVIVIGADLDLKSALTRGEENPAVTHLPDFTTFPDRWYGLEGVRQILVTTSNPDYLKGLSESRFMALEQWLRLGGEIVICIGSRGAELLQAENYWNRLVSGRFQFVEQQWKTAGLEVYAGAEDPLELATDGAIAAQMTVLESVAGRTEVYDGVGDAGQRPMVVRRLFGFGQVVFVAVDLDLPPFVDWPAQSRLLRRISLGDEELASGDSKMARAKGISRFGYEDLSGQLRAALGQFEGVTLVRFYWIVGLLVFYIALIGPLDYLLLKKWNRLHWTWITFPSVVLGFSLLAVVMSASFKSKQVYVNQLDIVDFDVETSQLRGTTWVYILSPESRTYDLQVKPKPTDQLDDDQLACLCSWQGSPGKFLGGLNTPSVSASIQQEYGVTLAGPNQARDSGRIQGLPIRDSSCRGLNARWWANCSLKVVSRLSFDRQRVLQGEISNPFPFALQNCRLYLQDRVYVIDDTVEAGEVLHVTSLVDTRKNAEFYLRRGLVSRAEYRKSWSLSETDVPRIVEMLMFHRKAGATRYTKLTHRYQGYLDLSKHLDWNRAILVGRAVDQASDLVSNRQVSTDASQTWTYYRVVFPISVSATP